MTSPFKRKKNSDISRTVYCMATKLKEGDERL
jgi:hypothetical protein